MHSRDTASEAVDYLNLPILDFFCHIRACHHRYADVIKTSECDEDRGMD